MNFSSVAILVKVPLDGTGSPVLNTVEISAKLLDCTDVANV